MVPVRRLVPPLVRVNVASALPSYGSHIDVCAPGVDITSTSSGGGYAIKFGTSLAAPHVAGLAGLMLAVNPGLYNDDIEQLRA